MTSADPPNLLGPAGPTQPISLKRTLRLAASDIKLAHSVFAMPFAVLAVFLARDPAQPWPQLLILLALVIICMVLARTWAMLVNRIADADFDRANPRTRGRAVASGHLSQRHARGVALGIALAFIAAAGFFWVLHSNPWPIALSIPVLAWVAFYSFTKRFTALCHLFLGGALAASPIAAAIAVRPEALATTPALWWLAGMVVLWVAGFDVIYALQDEDFDRQAGLWSIPAKLGARRAIWLSRIMHLAAAAALVSAARAEARLGLVFWVGVGCVGVLLVVEHTILARRGKAGLDMAFFTINGIVSCVLGAAGVADLLLA